jgi:hypothetical protein
VTITLLRRGIGSAVLAGALGVGAVAAAFATRESPAGDLALLAAAQQRADLWAQLLEQAAVYDVPPTLLWSGNIDSKSRSVRWMLRTAKRNFRGASAPGGLRLDLIVQDVRRASDGLVRARAVLDTSVRLYGQTTDSGGSEGRVLTFVPDPNGRLQLVSDVSDDGGVLGWWEDEPGGTAT